MFRYNVTNILCKYMSNQEIKKFELKEQITFLLYICTYYITAATMVYAAEQFVLQETFLSLKICGL